MPSIKLNSTTIYYETHGQGTPLLMLHGLGSCGADWLLQIPLFSEHYQVITPDFPGHGKSSASLDHLTISNIANDMLELLERLNISSCHVVGLSLGSFVAMELALHHPEKVKSLTLVGSSARVQDMNRILAKTYSFLVKICPMSVIGTILAWLTFTQQKYSLARTILKAHIACMNKQDFVKLYIDAMTFDVTSKLATIHCPALIIGGGKDYLLPKHHSEKLHRLIPNSHLEVIEESGHAVPIECAAEFNRLLSGFLENKDIKL